MSARGWTIYGLRKVIYGLDSSALDTVLLARTDTPLITEAHLDDLRARLEAPKTTTEWAVQVTSHLTGRSEITPKPNEASARRAVWDAAPAHRTGYRDVISSQKSGEDGRKLRATTLRRLLAEVRRLRGERGDLAEKLDAATKTAVRLAEQRDHLTSAFDKLGDQMGELVQAARSERERYTAENRRLRGEIADAAGYLAVIHRHASRHDVLGENLGCAGCALLARIEGGSAP